MSANKTENLISAKELLRQFSWYESEFPSVIEQAWDEFFNPNFNIKLFGLSKNINSLTGKESCFVTKIRIDEEYDMFFRLTDTAVDTILTKVLGESKSKFNINKLTELEVKIITSFNDYIFEKLKGILQNPPQAELKRSNFDMINMTFIVKGKDEESSKAGKFVVSVPLALISPQEINSGTEVFSKEDFPDSETKVGVTIGKTGFSLYELKHLEEGDVVVFENSNLRQVSINIDDKILTANINPNMDILITDENNGGDEMSGSEKNIWDSIEVEMSAEFDAVKVTLGELKNIEEGIVVDLASLYDNKVTLKVENRPIASGSLVIVNDRYGVKVDNVMAEGAVSPQVQSQEEEGASNQPAESASQAVEQPNAAPPESEEEEFDYSDFELEDENI